MVNEEASVEERTLMREFAASQERRNRIAMVIVFLGIVGFAGLKLYQRHLANEASKPIVVPVSTSGLTSP